MRALDKHTKLLLQSTHGVRCVYIQLAVEQQAAGTKMETAFQPGVC
jgi:hypothetical protein